MGRVADSCRGLPLQTLTMKCSYCKKQRDSYFPDDRGVVCSSCKEKVFFYNTNFYTGFPKWLLWITYRIGKILVTVTPKKSVDVIKKDTPTNKPTFWFIETVNFKDYQKNGGNVSRARVEEFRRRRLHPEGNGEVVLADKSGRITDKRAKA